MLTITRILKELTNNFYAKAINWSIFQLDFLQTTVIGDIDLKVIFLVFTTCGSSLINAMRVITTAGNILTIPSHAAPLDVIFSNWGIFNVWKFL